MRLCLVVLSIAVVLLAPSPGSAQPLQSFQDLALRIDLDDRLRIEDPSGVRVTGRLTHLTRDEITLSTDAGEKRFTSATVREVAVRRNSRRKGVLIGAGVGAVLGALAACVRRERSECVDGPVILGALGAGLGLTAAALAPRATTVYRLPTGMEPSRGSARPPGPFDDLALGSISTIGSESRIRRGRGPPAASRALRATR